MSGCVICFIRVCSKSERDVCVCMPLWTRVCTSAEEPTESRLHCLRPAQDLRLSPSTLRLRLLQAASLFLLCRGGNCLFFSPHIFYLFYSIFLHSWWVELSLHGISFPRPPFPLCFKVRCVQGNANTGLRHQTCQVEGVPGHVGSWKPPGLQQCPALLWLLEWSNGGLIVGMLLAHV